MPSTRCPLYSRTTSPFWNPAFAAGPSSMTLVISAPRTSGSFSALARSPSTSCAPMPRYPGVETAAADRARGRTVPTWPKAGVNQLAAATRIIPTPKRVLIAHLTGLLCLPFQKDRATQARDLQQGAAAIQGPLRNQLRTLPANRNLTKIGDDPQVVLGLNRYTHVRRNYYRDVTVARCEI